MSADRALNSATRRWALKSARFSASALLAVSLASPPSAEAQGYYYPPEQPPVYYYYGSPYEPAPVPENGPHRQPRKLRNYNERPEQSRRRTETAERQERPAPQAARQEIVIQDSQPQSAEAAAPENPAPAPQAPQQEETFEPAAAYSFPNGERATPELNIRRRTEPNDPQPAVHPEPSWTATSNVEAPSAQPSTAPSAPAPSGEEVARIQEKLQQLGYDPGPADGIMGSRTESALRQFQQARAISEPDALGPLTREALLQTGPPQAKSSVVASSVVGKLMNYKSSAASTQAE